MTGLLITANADGFAKPVEINNALEDLQAQVGGYIAVVPLHHIYPGLVMVVNEEGKIRQLPLNRKATRLLMDPTDYIAGNALLLMTSGDEFAGLPPQLLNVLLSFAIGGGAVI